MFDYGGGLIGPSTPVGYGSGGSTFKCWGCGNNTLATGWSGAPGVVIVDVLY